MAEKFSDQTFKYFDLAKKNRKNKKWFETHRQDYDEHVRLPFSHLIEKIKTEFSTELPQIKIDPKKISHPCYRANRVPEDGSIIKLQSSTFLSEKPTSMFEHNPGIYISIGQTSDDCVLGIGLYMVSGRQTSLLRHGLVDDFDEVDSILSSKKFKKSWAGLSGEKYKRFPKGFDENSPAAEYLMHRQFFLGQNLSRSLICSKKFESKICADIESALPALKWVRKTVGTYSRS